MMQKDMPPGAGVCQNAQPERGHHRENSTLRQRHNSTNGLALQVEKRGKRCIIAKLVEAQPLGEWVLAMPYRHRPAVEHVSLPPAAFTYAREHGARLWVVRFDARGDCYGLPLADVERVGWLHRSDGRPEWFVPLSGFHRIPWQDWPYVTETVQLGGDAPPPPQLTLWGGAP